VEKSIISDALAADLAKVRQARRMSPEMKFRAGSELFEEACRWSLAGISDQLPHLDEAGKMKELRRRLAIAQLSS
jgi:hypothetical protein